MEAFIVVDLGFGDSGKGACTDYLCRQHNATTVVRYSGGNQAGHTVVAHDDVTGKTVSHVFSCFGSGTFAGANTFLSRFVTVNPISLFLEGQALERLGISNVFSTMFVSENAVCITPYHVAMNRLREWSRSQRHGSCGMGFGEAVYDSLLRPETTLYFGDLAKKAVVREKLEILRKSKLVQLDTLELRNLPVSIAAELQILKESELYRGLSRVIADDYQDIQRRIHVVPDDFLEKALFRNAVVFEGAQGVLLDQDYGFFPYVTWSNTTSENAHVLLEEAGYTKPTSTVGLLRSHATRHGNGPFPSFDAQACASLPFDATNQTNEWQGAFRRGLLDLPLLEYALQVNGPVDELHVSHMDQVEYVDCKMVESYANDYRPRLGEPDLTKRMCAASPKRIWKGRSKREFLEKIEEVAGAPVTVFGFGPYAQTRESLHLLYSVFCRE